MQYAQVVGGRVCGRARDLAHSHESPQIVEEGSMGDEYGREHRQDGNPST